MAEAWRDLGFRVEICDYDDCAYTPPEDCVVAIDLHSNLERWEQQLTADCVRVLHATGCHWRFQNEAERGRLRALKQRRGFDLVPRRQVAPTRAAEIADHITMLGNDFTANTFRATGKPVISIPISSAYEFDWPRERDYESAKRRFLWLGSYGMVHKGLDLVLEAFAAMPDLYLTVCGRPEKEDDFFEAYKKELTQMPNISLRGWVDPASFDFKDIAATHGTIIYPSASEGGGGAVIHCMHAGLVPVCTPAASVNMERFGVSIDECSVEAVKVAARVVADLKASEMEDRASAAWHHVRLHHTRSVFRKSYGTFACCLAAAVPVC